MTHDEFSSRPSRLACALRTLWRRSVLLLALPAVVAQSEIRAPFGLAWGKPAIELEEALLGGSGRIVERKRLAGGGESWQVEGLPQPALQRAVFHLPKHQLAGIELQYGREDWAPENYDALMQSVKEQLEAKHGAGVLIARKQDSERGVLQTLLGYRWESPAGAIELVYFAAQNPENLYRAVSLHYSAPAPAAPLATKAAPAPASADDLSQPPLPPLPEP
jgi:hypothetical protein